MRSRLAGLGCAFLAAVALVSAAQGDTARTLMEAARRTIGWHLPVLGALAIAYGYFADFMPGPFRGPPKNLDDIVAAQYLGLDGMLGTPLQVAATFIILFTIYGAILEYTGAGKFYVDLAFALTGRRPTGAARPR